MKWFVGTGSPTPDAFDPRVQLDTGDEQDQEERAA